jgi:hypothetical protein
MSTALADTVERDVSERPFPAVGRVPRSYRFLYAWLFAVGVVQMFGRDTLAGQISDQRGLMVLWVFWGLFALNGLVGFITAGRRRFELTDDGVEFVGMYRRLRAPWSEVEWLGWVTEPANAFSPAQYRLTVRVRGHRVPYWSSWANAAGIAKRNDLQTGTIKHQVKVAAEDRQICYRERIPDMSETRLWWWTAAIFALVFIVLPIVIVNIIWKFAGSP